jgi:isopenicillin-N N-acyltransferase-like protein
MAVNIEAAPGDFSELYLIFPSNGTLAHTNHFEAPTFQGQDLSLMVMPDSPFRLHRFREALRELGSAIDPAALQRSCADHSNHPLGICCHPDPRVAPYDRSATVASAVMDLNDRRMWLADGHPCSTVYREIDYQALLKERSDERSDTQELVTQAAAP